MSTLVAMKMERVRNDAGEPDGFRALMFELSAEDDCVLVVDIVEASTARDAGRLLCERWPHESIAVLVGPVQLKEQAPDAVLIAGHWVVWPDAISATETAELLMEEDEPEEEVHIPDETMGSVELPSLETLNEIGASACALLVLRALCTSDLTFFYMLLEPDARINVAHECMELIEMGRGEAQDLTDEEFEEAKKLAAMMNE